MILWLLLLVFGVSCAEVQPPKMTPVEEDCLSDVFARKAASVAMCGPRVDAECSTDAIVDRAQKEAAACL